MPGDERWRNDDAVTAVLLCRSCTLETIFAELVGSFLGCLTTGVLNTGLEAMAGYNEGFSGARACSGRHDIV